MVFYQNYFWGEAAMKILQKTKPIGIDPEANNPNFLMSCREEYLPKSS
jgi:hypothetical protein